MKHFNLTIFCALLLVFTFSSCSKDNDPVEPSITGTWDIEKANMKIYDGNTLLAEESYYNAALNEYVGFTTFRFTGNNELFITDELTDNEQEVKYSYTVDPNNSKKLIVTAEDEDMELFPNSELLYSFEGDKLVVEFTAEDMYASLSAKVRADISARSPENLRMVMTLTSIKRK